MSTRLKRSNLSSLLVLLPAILSVCACVSPPLAFLDVQVGINPWVDDPWALSYRSWLARDSWFVSGRSH